jgi:3-phenylpropionate/trans-cinnamate dioxygenase alpha subunit
MRICRADCGNTKAFTCTYHGWTYDLGGRLVNVPHEDDGYHRELDKEAWGPVQVAQLDNYKGFIFGTWDPSAPSLEEYLGEMAWYLDAYIDRYEGGVEPVTSHKWVLDCNWKLAAEQFASDMYHGEIAHVSAHIALASGIKLPVTERSDGARRGGWQFSSTKGHGTGFFAQPGLHSVSPVVRQWMAETRDAVVARIGAPRTDYVFGHATIFPNFSFLSNGTMRVWHPRGPHQMETWAWIFVPKAAPPQIKDQLRRDAALQFSPAGILEQDDGENWNEIQKVLRGHVARHTSLNVQMGRGHHHHNDSGLPGKTNYVFAEEGARDFYQRWADLMSLPTWPQLADAEAAHAAAAQRANEPR